jgi:hypothetical protein
MRYASQIVNRGVLFVVRPGELRGVGQFGVPGAGRSASDQVRETVVPLRDPSVLRDVVEARRSFQGPLDGSPGNRHLVHRLGGADPAEVVVVPLVVGGEVALVLYGDNLPERRAIGPVDALEFMVSEAALAMERGLPEEGERALTERRPE